MNGNLLRGMMAAQAQRLDLDGHTVSYYVSGPDGGRPIVFLQGKRVPSRAVHGITAPRLVDAGLRVYHVDIPGCGETPAAEVDREHWLASLLDALGVKRPILVSVGMTGPFSLPLVTRQAERVAAFVAIAIEGIPDYAESLEEITVPVLAMWGDWGEGIRGLSVERSHFELLVQKVPNARLTSLPGNRSGMKRDEMEALIDSVLEFIDGLPNGENP